MKALRLVEPGKPLVEQDLPVPAPGPGEVLVRVRAAGICRSDVHYRSGASPTGPLPLTPGHEVAGVIEKAGPGVNALGPGDRVCLHYLVTCGDCHHCALGSEQFCDHGAMLGKHIDGGYAEYLCLPARSAVPLPDAIPFEQGAVLGCSSATCLHALWRAGLRAGETVALFGMGGLGMSAVQLARAFGARRVYAVDINPDKLEMAEGFGSVPIDATGTDPVEAIRAHTGGRGVDVALELVGLPATLRQALACVGVFGRAVVVGIADRPFEVDSYPQLLCKEASLLGSADHLLSELPLLIDWVADGTLDLSSVVSRTVPLEAGPVNAALDHLEHFASDVRTVIVP